MKIIQEGLEINELVDDDGELIIVMSDIWRDKHCNTTINKDEAIVIIEHLQKVFKLVTVAERRSRRDGFKPSEKLQ